MEVRLKPRPNDLPAYIIIPKDLLEFKALKEEMVAAQPSRGSNQASRVPIRSVDPLPIKNKGVPKWHQLKEIDD